MIRVLLFLVLLAASEPAFARARPPAPAFYPFHIRVTLGGEIMIDRDMVKSSSWPAESYRREWSAFTPACAGPGQPGLFAKRGFTLSLGLPPRPVRDQPYPPHAFLLEVRASLPETVRGRDGACAPHPAANEVRLSQVVILDPGRSTRIEGAGGLVVEVRRP